MPRRHAYYTLICSLPAMPYSFETAERVPISELRLQERLKMLTPEHARVVTEMADFLTWERQPLERRDAQIVDHAERFIRDVSHPFVATVIRRAMDIRTILTGLRRRRLDLEPSKGMEPLASHIVRNWGHPDFRLAGRYPWIPAIAEQLSAGDLSEVERIRLQVGWRYAEQAAELHFFDFEAVVTYLIRWELLYRWTQRNAERGAARFESLVTKAMGEYSDLFPSET